MNRKALIRMGTMMGLSYFASLMHKGDIKKGIVIFDGCNGQRFVIDSHWELDKIHHCLGKALIDFGKRKKCLEISKILSVNND